MAYLGHAPVLSGIVTSTMRKMSCHHDPILLHDVSQIIGAGSWDVRGDEGTLISPLGNMSEEEVVEYEDDVRRD